MSDLYDALNELAARGTPRGFDAVIAAAADDAARTGDGRVATGPGADDLDPVPFVDTEVVVRRGRAPLRSAIVAAGLAALLFVGVLAVAAVVGNGGSGSPEGAVRQLASAIKNGDPLAAADVVAPDELRALHGTIDAAERKAQELKVVENAGAPLAGVDFDVTGLTLSTQSLADGYAKVTVDAGTISASTHKARFSPLMQKVLRGSHDNSAQYDLTRLGKSNDLPTFVMTVRRGGKWYVSAAYTLLEYVREANNLPAADFGSGERDAAKLGADSPDAAVQESMRALSKLDWPALIAMAGPTELPVYDYRAALTVLAKPSSVSGGPSPGFTIDTMSTSAEVSGDTAKVLLKASGTTGSGKWSLDGGCFTYTSNDSSPDASFANLGTCEGTYPILYSLLFFPFGGLDPGARVTVVQHDGRWFVSAASTVFDQVDGAISKVDRRSLYLMLNVPTEIPPDGALTLGEPVTLHGGTPQGFAVLSFAGHQGEQLLGLAKSSGGGSTASVDEYSPPAISRVFAPDGSEIGDAYGMLSGAPLTLPSDGRYTVVLQVQGLRHLDVSVTVWDAANAPAEAKVDRGFAGSCTYGIISSECYSTSSGSSSVTATTVCAGTSDASSAVLCGDASSTGIIDGTNGQLGLNGVPVGGSGPPPTAIVRVEPPGTAPVAPTIDVTATTAPHG